MHGTVVVQALHQMRRQLVEQAHFLGAAMQVDIGAKQREPLRRPRALIGVGGDETVLVAETAQVVPKLAPLGAREIAGVVKAPRRVLRQIRHGARGGVQVLDWLVFIDHGLRLVVQMDVVDVDTLAVQIGGRAPHAGIEGQQGLDDLQRRVLVCL